MSATEPSCENESARQKNAGELPRLSCQPTTVLAHIEVTNIKANKRPAPTRQAKTVGMRICMVGLRCIVLRPH